MIFRAARILEERKEELAVLMTQEMGKVLPETRGDVQEAIDITLYAAGEGRRMLGEKKNMIEPPGPRAKEIIYRDSNIMSSCMSRPYPLVMDRARGATITDVEGKTYIDFVAGIAVMNVGHSNPEVSAAVTAQMEKMAHCAFTDFFADPPVRLAEKLKQLTGYDRVFFSNSGTESVEAAIKLAMWKLHRQSLLGFYGAFHGRTLGSLSLTCSTVKHKEHFPTFRAVHAHYGYCYRCPLHLEYPGCGIESYRYVHGNGKFRSAG